MKISIIIPTYGRPKVIENCLKSIYNIRKEIPKPFEVIVINNNAKKLLSKTSNVCKKSKLPIKEIKSKPVGSVKARNLGIKKAKGEIVFFFDDDVLVQKNYFKEIMKDYKDKKISAVCGSEIKGKQSIIHKLFFLFNKPGSIRWCGEVISNFSPDYKKKILVKHMHGSNFSMRKSVLKKIGLMDEKMMGHYRDETEFNYRIYKLGFKMLFNPFASVIHKESSVGGNVDPSRKKKWAYWYHRNSSYFFFKHIYGNNLLKLLAYLIEEFFMSIFRVLIYKNIFYIIEISAIKEGYELNK